MRCNIQFTCTDNAVILNSKAMGSNLMEGNTMTEEIKRLRRVCFTGHRPEKLNRSEKSVLDGLETAIRQAIVDGSNVFISGMAARRKTG